MNVKHVLTTAGAAGVTVLAPADAASAAPQASGCKDFGQNVGNLATRLGPDFGATASEVASSSTAAIRTSVVAVLVRRRSLRLSSSRSSRRSATELASVRLLTGPKPTKRVGEACRPRLTDPPTYDISGLITEGPDHSMYRSDLAAVGSEPQLPLTTGQVVRTPSAKLLNISVEPPVGDLSQLQQRAAPL